MPANTIPIFPILPRIESRKITDADGTTKLLLFAPGANSSRLNKLSACSDDSVGATLKFYLSKDSGSTFDYLGSTLVSAGYEGDVSAAMKCLDLSSGTALPPGADVYVAVASALTAGKTITVTAVGSDY